MQIKGFVFGLAVASLGWLAWSATGERATAESAAAQPSGWQLPQSTAGAGRQDSAMCPYVGRAAPPAGSKFSDRRNTHEAPVRCPYSGRTMPRVDGQFGARPGARVQQVPLDI